MKFINTRNTGESLKSAEAILQGLAANGGLYVPEEIPTPNIPNMQDYVTHASWTLQQFFTDFTESEIKSCVENAYNTNNFDTTEIAPVKHFSDINFLELFHGKTLAFKDMALSLLPHLISASLKKTGVKTKQVILTATSGDTGIATMEGFKNIDNMQVIVFYPENGVSFMQKMQMVTHDANNTVAIAVKGNFDDAQSAVKRIFLDENLREKLNTAGCEFASANSINIGRLVPQVAYYFYAYSKMVANGMPYGEKISFVVPTGNFGNILAGYYAKKMGLPINKLICASNENNVLYHFFTSGRLDSNRKLILTSSPSMDILLPSNFERLVFDIHRGSGEVNSLAKSGIYENPDKHSDFEGFYASEAEVESCIKNTYEKYNYLIDPHTAVAAVANSKYQGSEKRVIVSTASPYKFAKTVMTSLDPKYADMEEADLIDQVAKQQNEEISSRVSGIRNKEIKHRQVVEISEMKDTVAKLLGVS